MKDKHLHIVSFNIPYPANYGGVIDIFYKIKALHDIGVKVHLHSFHYGREKSSELEAICHKVHYYPREKFYQAIFSSVPYIVGSRKSGGLLANLGSDRHPVLFEGLHTCFYLNHPLLKDKTKVVRMHNVEWDYYSSLGKAERNFFLKFYFYSESKKLKQFEENIKEADLIIPISPADTEYFSEKYETVHYVPAFHPNLSVKSLTGKGDYAIYHGNLGVQENNQAAMFLAKKIFDDIELPLKISGKKPLNTLKKSIKNDDPKIELIPNPYDEIMQDLISNAQMNVLPTFQATGIKLKLLNALYNGRWCIVNKAMIDNTGLEPLCVIADSADEMKAAINELKDKSFTEEEIEKRKTLLDRDFSNETNAKRLIELIYSAPR